MCDSLKVRVKHRGDLNCWIRVDLHMGDAYAGPFTNLVEGLYSH